MAWDSLQYEQVLQSATEPEVLDFAADLLTKLTLDSLNAVFTEFDGATRRALIGFGLLLISRFKDENFITSVDDLDDDSEDLS